MQIKCCIYSIRRSGRHIVEEFLRNHLNYQFCNCCFDDETIAKECYNTHIHLKHETTKQFKINQIKKCIFLYRKDIVEQVDSVLRLLYSEKNKRKILNTKEEHTSCILDSTTSYKDFISELNAYYGPFFLKGIVACCKQFYRDIANNQHRNIVCIDFDSLVYTPASQLRKIAIFIGCINKTKIKKTISNYLPSLRCYTKKKMTYMRYIELSNIIYESIHTEVPKVILTKGKLLVVSHGGSATTSFMEFIGKYISTNCPKDLDGLKHTIPSKIEVPSHIIYIYGDMDKTMRSLFRRKAGELTIASIHEHKLKGLEHSIDLPANFEDFEAYTKNVTLENKEPVGCLVHMRHWKKVPNIFFIHYEKICTSETIDEYLGIPKGTCSQFTVLQRVSELQPCETSEYLETMKGLDLRVQQIITDQPHKSNILIVSFPRSGFNLLKTIFQLYFSIKQCACQKNIDVTIKTCVKEDVAFHRAHDMDLAINKAQFNKIIILYRKDIVEQLDAFFRYQFRKFDREKRLNSLLSQRSSCHELDISYCEKSDFFRNVSREYKDWVKKWITEPTPNSIIIEYSEFMKNPQITLDKIQEHLLENKDPELSAKIVEEMKIEYKHSVTPEKYKELANLLSSL